MSASVARLDANAMHEAHCPVCDAELRGRGLPAIILSSRGRQTWTKCPSCRSFFVFDEYDVEEETAHTRTRAWGNTATGFSTGETKSRLFEIVLRRLRDLAPHGGNLLDVGCSYGNFLERARNAGFQVRGLDIVPEAVEFVRSRGIVCDRVASVANLALAAGTQDVITVMDASYYWPNHRRELRAIWTLLKPRGLLVMRVVDTSWVLQLGLWLQSFARDAGNALCQRFVYDHRVSIHGRSLLKLLREERFDIVYSSGLDANPFHHARLKVRAAYLVGDVLWRVTGHNFAPGLVVFAQKL